MKKFLLFFTIWAVFFGCKTPMTITAHPDDQTFTSGTAGSARMTTEMPHKPENVVVKPDTSKIRMDSVHAKQ